MGMRQSLVRVCAGTTALLLVFLVLTTVPDLRRAQRFENAQAIIEALPSTQRLQVLDRIAWLNGSPVMPSVRSTIPSAPDQQLRIGIDIAKARLEAARPLPDNLESLAKDANRAPQWTRVRWRIGLFVSAITLLWALLYLGFWITSDHREAARQPLRQ
jgi:hypothetical protein